MLRNSNAPVISKLSQKYAVEVHLRVFLAFNYLLNVYIEHDNTPEENSKGVVFPLLKELDLVINRASSYRPVTVAPILGKL